MEDKSLDETIHYLLQFDELPNWLQRQELDERGFKLTNYVGGNTYIASSIVADLTQLREIPNVRAADEFREEFKLSIYVKTEKPGEWAVLDDGRVVYVVQFQKDVEMTKALQVIKKNGGEIVAEMPIVPSIIAAFKMGDISNLVKDDSVLLIDFVEPPLVELNDGAKVSTSVNPLNAIPYSLTGNGVTILVFDTGRVDTHIDFGARIIENDGSAFTGHATHVAGTVGGSGANSNGNNNQGQANGGTANQWAGMATAVNIRSFGNVGGAAAMYNGGAEINNDFPTAINNGIDLGTMSLGHNAYRWTPPACSQLGDYSNTAVLIDNIVTGSINNQQLIFLEAVGNERAFNPNLGFSQVCGNWGTISSPATAKNSIAVGAINSNNNSMTAFSSWGPTDDGRLKPDITAPGCQTTVDGGLTSPGRFFAQIGGVVTLIRNGYIVLCGSSMATPVASGSASLLIEQWKTTRGANSLPLPHTVKAVFIHTATDLGNLGPDYQFGWGALNAQAGVDLVIADDTEDLIHVDQVDNGQVDSFEIVSDGVNPIEVTLVWDDPTAIALAANTLVNDLDLLLTDPNGNTYQPFVLNAAVPAANATPGIDSTNNVEVIVSLAGTAGKWQVTVTGTTVPQGPQQYTLITSEGTTKPSKCEPNFAYGVYPIFYATIHQIPEAQYAQFISDNLHIAHATNLQLVKYINSCLIDTEIFERVPICIDIGDPPGPIPGVPIPRGPIIGKCPPMDPCPFGIQCPNPFENIRAEVPSFVLRDVGNLINEKITLNQFNNNLNELITSNQIKIITPQPSTQKINLEGVEYNVDYFIRGGSLSGITANVESKSLTAEIGSVTKGDLVIKLPRELIDAKFGSEDVEFMVLVDGVKKDYEETSRSSYRALKIPFSPTTEKIEIVGTFIVPEFGTITMMILAVGVVSIIAFTAKTKLIPRL